MPKGISALSSHILFSEYRGPRLVLEDGVTPPPAPEPKPNPEPAPAPNPKPDETEGRISELVSKTKEQEKRIKEFEKAERERQEAEAKAKGEHEKLAKQYASERDSVKAEKETLEGKLKVYEEYAKKQVDDSIKAIGDKEKQKTAKEMLEGKAPEEQLAMLPKILALVGAQGTSFGGPAPASSKTPDKNDLDAKKARHTELITKTKAGTITGAERGEMHRLSFELSDEFRKEQEAKTTT